MSYSLRVWQALMAGVYVADKVRQGAHDYVPTARIAEDLGIPSPSLARILGSLHRAGIVATKEGAGGGIRLAVPPEQVTLLDIVDAVDQGGPLFRTDSQPAVDGPTPGRRVAALRAGLNGAQEAMREHLQGITLAEISEA